MVDKRRCHGPKFNRLDVCLGPLGILVIHPWLDGSWYPAVRGIYSYFSQLSENTHMIGNHNLFPPFPGQGSSLGRRLADGNGTVNTNKSKMGSCSNSDAWAVMMSESMKESKSDCNKIIFVKQRFSRMFGKKRSSPLDGKLTEVAWISRMMYRHWPNIVAAGQGLGQQDLFQKITWQQCKWEPCLGVTVTLSRVWV